MPHVKPLVLVKGLHEAWNFPQLSKRNLGCCWRKNFPGAHGWKQKCCAQRQAKPKKCKQLHGETRWRPRAGTRSTYSVSYWHVLLFYNRKLLYIIWVISPLLSRGVELSFCLREQNQGGISSGTGRLPSGHGFWTDEKKPLLKRLVLASNLCLV